VQKDEESDSESPCSWKLCLVLSAAALYVFSLVLWVLESNFFGPSGCGPQQTVIALTIILTLALSVVSCSKIAPHGTLLTSAIVTAYATYLCYSALAAHPNEQCNPFVHHDVNSVTDLLVGFVVFAISMGAILWSALGTDQILGKSTSNDLTVSLEGGATSSSSAEGALAPEEGESVGAESWWYYHLVMVVCALYMAMLLSDWSTQPVDQPKGGEHTTSLESFWVKLVSQWVCLAMYAWTLLAPYLLRDVRDFGVEFDF